MLDNESDKVKKICDVLRRETLEPAKKQAEEIIAEAHGRAQEIIDEAKREAENFMQEAHEEVERKKNIFQSSLYQACKQALESLKQSIEEKLFDQQLSQLITKGTQSQEVIAQLITAVIKGVEKEGISGNLSAYVPASVPARSINQMLSAEILNKLKEKSVLIGPMEGGIEVKLRDQNITLDLSDKALKDLVASYIRKDFREMLFGNG